MGNCFSIKMFYKNYIPNFIIEWEQLNILHKYIVIESHNESAKEQARSPHLSHYSQKLRTEEK